MYCHIMTKKELMRFLTNEVSISVNRLGDKASPKKEEKWRECADHLENLIEEISKI
jgi:hypothetical protein